MTRLVLAVLTLHACGSSPIPLELDGAMLDIGTDSATPEADAGVNDSAPDDPSAHTGCAGDGWCWVMGVPIHDIHGVDPSAVFAVGAEGTIRVHDGSAWTDHSSPTRSRIDSVVARSADAVWILTNGEVWHYDGSDWTLQLRDDPSDWPTDMLILDSAGELHTARRQYSGSEYGSILRTYSGGTWVVGDNHSVEEANPASSYDELRASLAAYEHAFDPAYWDEAPAEVWVDGALAAWGTSPSDVIRARRRAEFDAELVWERTIPPREASPIGFSELTIPADGPPSYYRLLQEPDDVAGFADGVAIVVYQRQTFVVEGASVRPWAGLGAPPQIRALADGRVAMFFVEEVRGLPVGRIRVHRSETESRDYAIDFSMCAPNPSGDTGARRFVDVDVYADEIWASVMMEASRTGTPCLFHFDGDDWAARRFEEYVLRYEGYTLTVDGAGALLFGDGDHIVEVPRAFMRSGEPLSSLERTLVPEAAGFRDGETPRIWRGPTGLWLYQNDQALFRRSE